MHETHGYRSRMHVGRVHSRADTEENCTTKQFLVGFLRYRNISSTLWWRKLRISPFPSSRHDRDWEGKSDVLPIRPVSSQVCFQCHDKEESEHCENCGDRFAIFKYTKEDKDDQAVSLFTEFHLENATQVVRRFVDYITQDVSMKGRILLAHNGGKWGSTSLF